MIPLVTNCLLAVVVLQKETSHPGRLQRLHKQHRKLIILHCRRCRATTGEERECAAASEFKFHLCSFASRTPADKRNWQYGGGSSAFHVANNDGSLKWTAAVARCSEVIKGATEDHLRLLGAEHRRSGFPRGIPGPKNPGGKKSLRSAKKKKSC